MGFIPMEEKAKPFLELYLWYHRDHMACSVLMTGYNYPIVGTIDRQYKFYLPAMDKWYDYGPDKGKWWAMRSAMYQDCRTVIKQVMSPLLPYADFTKGYATTVAYVKETRPYFIDPLFE